MIYQLKNIAPAIASFLILIFLEIFSTTILPIVGITYYRLPFNILLSIYMAFKLETIYLPLLIFIMHYIHSFFSIEGWEIGTISGVSICLIVSYLRHIVQLSSYMSTIIITQVFQILWQCIASALLYSKGVDTAFVISKFWRFIPESIVLSLAAPFLFPLLDKIWNSSDENLLRHDV